MSKSSNIKRMKTILSEVKLRERELTNLLINTPNLGEFPEKNEMYNMAIHYFEARRERRRNQGKESYNGAMSLKLLTLIQSYEEAQANSKPDYAREIAQYILEMPGYWLKLIPEETKDEAFRIVIEYLEEQRCS